ncbi:MAG: hypothetical protein K2J48_02505 [Muribaculaceae bacterium]|nr:hypothetical protein [Muribaculaceae bacterium]MDE6791943.1 hypothetical protein [Muribaculaceae bacterium]
MIDDELRRKFESIEDLPISEEMIGGYLEGTLSERDRRDVEEYIGGDPYMANLMYTVSMEIENNRLSSYNEIKPSMLSIPSLTGLSADNPLTLDKEDKEIELVEVGYECNEPLIESDYFKSDTDEDEGYDNSCIDSSDIIANTEEE